MNITVFETHIRIRSKPTGSDLIRNTEDPDPTKTPGSDLFRNTDPTEITGSDSALRKWWFGSQYLSSVSRVEPMEEPSPAFRFWIIFIYLGPDTK